MFIARFHSSRLAALVLGVLPLAAADPDPARIPRKPRYVSPAVEGQIVLIGFKEAERPVPGSTRSKEEALALARQVVDEARQRGVRFDDVVAKYSEDPYKEESLGMLGTLPRGTFPVQAVEAALFDMCEGQVSDPIETPSGYVVAMRLAYQTCASHIVVAWGGCKGAAKHLRRTKAEAHARALELRKRILDGEDFARVAKECSDDPSSMFGGHLGFVKRGTMPREFDSAVFALSPGEVSEPVETEFGYHIILARPFAEASHILVAFKEAREPLEGVTRTRAEALARVEQALARIQAGEAFERVAAEVSDDLGSAREGGHLPPRELGQSGYVKEFEDALYQLRPGEISGIVESPFGFHIILRWR